MSWGEQYDALATKFALAEKFAHIQASPSQPKTSNGTCLLPNGNSVEMGADECAKQKGHWSPNHAYTGWVGRGGGLLGDEPGEVEDPGESAADEAAEESTEGAPAGAAPTGGGLGV